LHYDVLIIGAGPAGCTAARLLSSAGFKVLLADRQKIPSQRSCPCFLSPRAVELCEEIFATLPADVLSNPPEAWGAKVIFEDGSIYELPFPHPGLSVSRDRLDAFMSSLTGADIMAPFSLKDLELGRFRVRADLEGDGTAESVEATYLIGADGGDSTILSYIRPEFFRTYAAPNLLKVTLLLAGGRVDMEPGWMGLVVQKGVRAMHRLFIREGLIGVAISHGLQIDFREQMGRVVDLLGAACSLELEEQSVSMSSVTNIMGAGGKFSLGAGSALMAGEAAGLLDPWGFGVRLAIESGRIAAESLIDSAGQSVTPHLHYRSRMQQMLEREIGQRRRLAGLVGEVDAGALAADRTRGGRRNRRELRKHLF
jgi:flavin-dependent dehydrogenase